jgi:hypothetical protein
VSDRNRDTVPPPAAGRLSRAEVPRPRARLSSQRDRDEPVDRDEHLLQVMAEMERRIADKIADVRIEAVEEAKKSIRPGPAEPQKHSTTFFQQLPAVLIALTGLVAAFAAFYKPTDTTKGEEAYKAVRDAQIKQDTDIAARAKIDDERWKFTIGLFKRIPGITIVEAPGQEPIEPIDISPPPRTTKPPAAPTIQVRQPLPPAPASAAPVKLPPPEQLFKKVP